MSKILIIGAGGAGINLAKKFINRKQDGYADIDVFLIDTSKSNLPPNFDDNNTYLFKDMDGNGKLRNNDNLPTIKERIKEAAQKIQKADLYIVLHSVSGGSGSIIGPLLSYELLSKGHSVIAMTIGSTDSRIEIENTIKTLKTYETLSGVLDRPFPMFYEENSIEKQRGKVDLCVETNIVYLSVFFSGNIKELDTSDLRNFLDYHRVTHFKPTLTGLDFFTGEPKIDQEHVLISAVSITNETISTKLATPVEYQATGYIGELLQKEVTVQMPVHLVTIGNYFGGIIKKLEKELQDIDNRLGAVVVKKIIGPDQKSNDDFLVL